MKRKRTVQMDLPLGRKLRNEGIARVLTPEEHWQEALHSACQYWFDNQRLGVEFTCETLRQVAYSIGLEEPRNANGWSGGFAAIFRKWRKWGVVIISSFELALRPEAHARRIPKYRKVFPDREQDYEFEPAPNRPQCPHGNVSGECSACDIAGDLAFDSAREARFFR